MIYWRLISHSIHRAKNDGSICGEISEQKEAAVVAFQVFDEMTESIREAYTESDLLLDSTFGDVQTIEVHQAQDNDSSAFEIYHENKVCKVFPEISMSRDELSHMEVQKAETLVSVTSNVVNQKEKVAGPYAYHIFDEMPKLTLVDPNEESSAYKGFMPSIDCVPLILDQTNGSGCEEVVVVTCLSFDPGGAYMSITTFHDTLSGKYACNDKKSVPEIYVGGLEVANNLFGEMTSPHSIGLYEKYVETSDSGSKSDCSTDVAAVDQFILKEDTTLMLDKLLVRFPVKNRDYVVSVPVFTRYCSMWHLSSKKLPLNTLSLNHLGSHENGERCVGECKDDVVFTDDVLFLFDPGSSSMCYRDGMINQEQGNCCYTIIVDDSPAKFDEYTNNCAFGGKCVPFSMVIHNFEVDCCVFDPGGYYMAMMTLIICYIYVIAGENNSTCVYGGFEIVVEYGSMLICDDHSDTGESILTVHDICIPRKCGLYALDDSMHAYATIIGSHKWNINGVLFVVIAAGSVLPSCIARHNIDVMTPITPAVFCAEVIQQLILSLKAYIITAVLKDWNSLWEMVGRVAIIQGKKATEMLSCCDAKFLMDNIEENLYTMPFWCANPSTSISLSYNSQLGEQVQFYIIISDLVLHSFYVALTMLASVVWDPDQDASIFYIIEDNDVLKRKGMGIPLALTLKEDDTLNGASTHYYAPIGLLVTFRKPHSLKVLFVTFRSMELDCEDIIDAMRFKRVEADSELYNVVHNLTNKDASLEMMLDERVVFVFDPGINSLFDGMFQSFPCEVVRANGGLLLINNRNKYRPMFIRVYTSFWMIGDFALIIYLGHLYIWARVWPENYSISPVFILFILPLKKMYMYQFGQYAWKHMIMIVIFTQSSFTVTNNFKGIFWFNLPASLIVINDTTPYY